MKMHTFVVLSSAALCISAADQYDDLAFRPEPIRFAQVDPFAYNRPQNNKNDAVHQLSKNDYGFTSLTPTRLPKNIEPLHHWIRFHPHYPDSSTTPDRSCPVHHLDYKLLCMMTFDIQFIYLL